MARSIPLAEVVAVAITQREVGQSAMGAPLIAPGTVSLTGRTGGRLVTSRPKVTTDITVRTVDGQAGRWVVEQRSGSWVEDRIGAVLTDAGIPLG